MVQVHEFGFMDHLGLSSDITPAACLPALCPSQCRSSQFIERHAIIRKAAQQAGPGLLTALGLALIQDLAC